MPWLKWFRGVVLVVGRKCLRFYCEFFLDTVLCIDALATVLFAFINSRNEGWSPCATTAERSP